MSHCGAAADGATDFVTEVVEEQEGEEETDGVELGAIDGATDALAEKDGVEEALLDTVATGVGVVVLEIVALLDAEVVAVPEGEAETDGESVRKAVCETLREVEPDTVAVAAVAVMLVILGK